MPSEGESGTVKSPLGLELVIIVVVRVSLQSKMGVSFKTTTKAVSDAATQPSPLSLHANGPSPRRMRTVLTATTLCTVAFCPRNSFAFIVAYRYMGDSAALRARPSDEEIARRRAEKTAAKKSAPPTKHQAVAANQKKERNLEAEASALRDWAVRPLVDIGANLQARGDWDQVVALTERAALAGVEWIVLTGCDIPGSTKGVEYAERWSERGGPQRLYATAGVHPHEAKAWDNSSADIIRRLAASPVCISLGEAGLDYDRMLSPKETQLRVFRAQADLARELSMPLFVHVRERDEGEPLGAYRDALHVLALSGIEPTKCCIHCFTGDSAQLELVLEFGAYVGFTGFVGIAKRNAHTLAAIKSNPGILDRIMCETDAPYMLPDKTWLPTAQIKRLGVRGGKNEPAVLPAVCRALAAALSTDTFKVDAETVAQVTTRNAHAFFGVAS